MHSLTWGLQQTISPLTEPHLNTYNNGQRMPPSGSGASRNAEDAKLDVWKQALYDRIRELEPENGLFSQEDLLRLDVIPNNDLALLARVLQDLSNDKLFVTMREASGQVFWKWRDAQEASKYKQCSTDEEIMVYSLIDDSGGDGIWSQTVQKRLNMHDSVFKNAVKHLQTKGLIRPFKNVEHPNKKMYIKASIRPSERATGGPWYTDQNLDEPFIEQLQRLIFDIIKVQGSYKSTHSGAARSQVPKKGVLKGGISDKGKKRGADEMENSGGSVSKSTTSATSSAVKREAAFLPLPAGYVDYPTARDIARILSKGNITNGTILSEEDVRKLIDVLIWDNLVEPISVAGKLGYKATRVAKQTTERWSEHEGAHEPQTYMSAYTEAPCGRCPVFDLCEEGGPVGPSNCVYFKTWLGTDVD